MAGIPESFMIYKEELRKEKFAKEKLENEYNQTISELKVELSLLQEKIHAQGTMIKTMANYATKIEHQLETLNQKVNDDKKKSYH